MSLTTRITAAVRASQSSLLDLGSAGYNPSLARSFDLASGVGADQADLIFADTRTLAASATENLDLAGVLTDAFGAVITFARVKALYVAAAAANTNLVLVGGAATNGFVNWVGDTTDIVRVRPGGAFLLVAPDATGYPVTGATGDILKVANSGAGTAVTYDVLIVGASA